VVENLLGPAANLLTYQVDNRLIGVAKAQVATRLRRAQAMGQCPGPDRGGPGRGHQTPARQHLLGQRQLGYCGQKVEDILDARWSDTVPLSDSDRAQVMRTAVAYSLANYEAGLARVRAHFAPKMKGTPDAGLFAVLSSNIDQHGLAFREAAAKIAAIDTLQTFMKDFAKRKSDAKS